MEPLLTMACASFKAAILEFKPDAVLPVPLGRWRRFRRGFNQSYLIALSMQKLTGSCLPYLPGVRRRGASPQARRTRADRIRAMQSAFYLYRPRRVRGLRILIVDDVMTTGATVESLSKSLLQAGAEAVQVWTLARRGRKEPT